MVNANQVTSFSIRDDHGTFYVMADDIPLMGPFLSHPDAVQVLDRIDLGLQREEKHLSLGSFSHHLQLETGDHER